MAKNTCSKKGKSKKDRSFAEVRTRHNKALRLYRVCVNNPNDHTALNAFAQAVHPETVKQWLARVQP